MSSLNHLLVFDENRKVRMAYSALVDLLTKDTAKGESVMDYYVKKVVLPCGTIHNHTLGQIQDESLARLQFEAFEGWSDTLWERVTWHDAVLWFMLLTLSKEYSYVTSKREREMLKAVYDACTMEDGERFKIMTALIYSK
jgi:hypothetical protein